MTQRTCDFDGCGNLHHARGLCSSHNRQRKLGQELRSITPNGKAPAESRFWARVEKSEECWAWVGQRAAAGYGFFRDASGNRTLAHRVSWQLHHNSLIPSGMVIDHLCHNPSCVRPDHLQVVTQKQNSENARQRKSRSGVRGVTWNSSSGKWEARVTHNWVSYRCGKFDTIEEAGAAAKAKRLELFTNNQHDLV